MKNTIRRKHFLLYANNYSRELLEDYVAQYKISDYELINIGSGGSKTSQFCTVNKAWYASSIIVSRLSAVLRKKLKHGESINVVVPCTNHLMAGMLISLAERNPNLVQLDHVVEGTLNYCNRKYFLSDLTFPVIYRVFFARLIKKFLSLIFNFNYLLSFADNVDIILKSSLLICRNIEGIETNAIKFKVIPTTYGSKCLFSFPEVTPTLAIIGSHIIESYLGVSLDDRVKFFKPLSDKINNLSNNLRKLDVIYLPHPRAKQNGLLELSYIYNGLSPSVFNDTAGAKNFVLRNNPSHILCLGGSTLFMELADIDFKGEMIAWGFDELIVMGCDQANRLLEVQKKLKVTIL